MQCLSSFYEKARSEHKTIAAAMGSAPDQEATVRCPSHQSCDREGQNIAVFPMDDFKGYPYLIRELFFGNNDIENLPDEFFTCLPRLEFMDFNSNKLKSLPKGIQSFFMYYHSNTYYGSIA